MSSHLGPPLLSVVIPVYRNEDTLRALHERLVDALLLLACSFEIVFVDDASPDGSADVLAELEAERVTTRVISLKQNVGQQWAVLVGLRAATGAMTVILDADIQDRPESIPTLVRAATERVDVVCAGRRGSFQSRSRMLTSRLFKWVLHKATGLPRDAGIFLLVRAGVVERMLALRTERPHVLTLVGCTGAAAISVPVERDRRPGGGSAYSAAARVRAGARALGCLLDLKRGRPGPSVGEQLERMVSCTPPRGPVTHPAR